MGPIATANSYSSLPRRSAAFHRNTPARRSAGIGLENHIEYFVPRSVSEFNLAGVGDLALPPPPPMINKNNRLGSGIATIIQPSSLQTTSLLQQKPREKMVTFEDESSQTKCPHGMPTTPARKSLAGNQGTATGPIAGGDVFM